MASYIQNSLIDDEKIIYSGRISIWAYLVAFILGVLFIPLFGIGLLLILIFYLHYRSIEVAFTDRRLIAKYGFISRHTIELNIEKIESIQVQQGILGRVFNYGSLIVSGAGNPQAPVPAVSDPMAFRRALLEYQDKLK